MSSNKLRKQLEELKARGVGVKECPECGYPHYKNKPPMKIVWLEEGEERPPQPCAVCGTVPQRIKWRGLSP